MSLPPCKLCGNTACDQRSGICGRCAFKKQAMLIAFADELEKISIAGGPRSYMMNLGTRIMPRAMQSASRLYQNIQQGALNWGQALATAPARTLTAGREFLTSPIQTTRQGWTKSLAPTDPSKGMRGNLGAMGSNAMMIAGTAIPAAVAFPSQDPTGRGESRLTRGMRAAVGGVAGIAGMKHGMLPSAALGAAGDLAGGAIGRRIDKARGYKPKKKPTVDAPTPGTPTKAAIMQQAVQQ